MGKVVHFEIPADNMERAAKFYKEVFGWEMMPMPEMKYTVVRTGPTSQDGMTQGNGFINGGIMNRKDIKNPVIVMDVASVDESVKLAEANGAKIVRPKVRVGDMGFIAYITDSEGNIIGIWQNIKK